MCSLVGSIRADRACTWDRPQAARALIAQAQATQVDLDSTNHLVDRHESDSESRVARCLMPIPRADLGLTNHRAECFQGKCLGLQGGHLGSAKDLKCIC